MNRGHFDPAKYSAVAERAADFLGQRRPQGDATCLAFDPRGVYLASGHFDGDVHFWDLDLLGEGSRSADTAATPVRVVTAAAAAICGISWSRDGSKIVACAAAEMLCIDVESGALLCRHECAAQIKSFALCGAASGQTVIVALGPDCDAALLRVHADRFEAVPTTEPLRASAAAFVRCSFGAVAVVAVCGAARGASSTELKRVMGAGVVSDLVSVKDATVEALGSAASTLAVQGRSVIRLYKVEDGAVRLLAKLVNPVDLSVWHSIGFVGAGERLVSCTRAADAFEVYVWESASGSLIKRISGEEAYGNGGCGSLDALACELEGTRIATATKLGAPIRIWTATQAWSYRAFAPGFEELHANVVYVEREDEFDSVVLNDERGGGGTESIPSGAAEAEAVDVLRPHSLDEFDADDRSPSFARASIAVVPARNWPSSS